MVEVASQFEVMLDEESSEILELTKLEQTKCNGVKNSDFKLGILILLLEIMQGS